MRILFISRTLPYLGGREIIVEGLINYFKKYHNIAIITPDKNIKRVGVKIIDSNQNFKRIEEQARKFKPQIINCHTFYFADIAIHLAQTFNIPLIFTLHGVFLKFYDKDYRSIIKKICVKSDYVITVSKNYKNQLISFLKNKQKSKIVSIRNGIPLNIDRNLSKIKNIRKKYGLPINKKIVIIPSRINKIKGINYVVEAFKYINNNNIIFLIGSPKGRKNKYELILKDNLKKSLKSYRKTVLFKNFSHRELQEVFLACDMCLLSSLMEGISLSILEAMSAGLIIAATNVGGSSEIIQSGKSGFLIKPKSSDEIAKIIYKVFNLSDKDKNKIIKNAKKRVATYFSEKKMLKSYQNLFNKIIIKFTHENK